VRLILGPERHWRRAAALADEADLILLRSPDTPATRVEGFNRRLELRFNDIAEPRDGLLAATADMIAELLAFGRASAAITVLCYAGVSRSTAVGYALACQALPTGEEARLAASLRSISPSATPNALVVALADTALGRQGRMSRAVAAIGRGSEAFEGPLSDWRIDGDAAGD